jgi:RimJ/RimL family protein N-acetyltransferase
MQTQPVSPLPGPAYRVETPRLVIRCWNPADAPLLKAAIDENLEHLRPWMPWAHSEPTDLQVKIDNIRRWRAKFDQGEDFVYGIFSQDESRVLGGTGLHTRVGQDAREIGYWIHKDCINQGIATEAAAALTKVGFEVDRLVRIEIHCAVENVRSAAVPRKLGYNLDGILRQRSALGNGQRTNTMVWTLLQEEYANTPSAQAQVTAYDAAGRKII